MADTILVHATSETRAVLTRDDGQRVVAATGAAEAHSDGNWGDYLLTPSQLGSSNDWVYTLPAGLAAGTYALAVFLGDDPAVGDEAIGAAELEWDGAAIRTRAAAAATASAIKTVTDKIPGGGMITNNGTVINLTAEDHVRADAVRVEGQTGVRANVTAIKAKTDLLTFDGSDLLATLDGEQVAVGSVAAGAITADAIASSALTAAKFGAGFITSSAFAAGAITTAAIADEAITPEKFSDPPATADDIASGGSAGSEEVVIPCEDDAGNPLDGCAVWISTDAASQNVVQGAVHSDGSGEATVWLDPGDYYVWRQMSGINFNNPQQITVTAS